MAKITSKALLVEGTELTINEVAKTFTLNVAGNLVAKDGVTIQALYSKFVDLWATPSKQDSPFPMYAIDALSGQFQFGTDGSTYSGWKPADDATRQMLRDGGWSEYSSAGVLQRQYVGIVGLGNVSTGAQLYYQRASTDAPSDFTFDDQCNEGIQVFGDASNGNFDKRTYFKGFVREPNKKYKDSVLADTGKTATGAYIVNLLLSNEDDLKTYSSGSPVLDAAMSGAPYSGITVSYYATNQTRTIGGTGYPFRIIIDGNGATLEQIYIKVQYLLRQDTNINTAGDAGSVTGKTAAALLEFIGDTLQTTTGVYIDDIQNADSNRVIFKDYNGINRTNPYTASGTLNFNAFLVGAGSYYRLFYTTYPGAGNDYGEAGAVTVQNSSATDIAGTISSASLPFDFDWDAFTGSGDPFDGAAEINVTLVAGRPGSAKPVVASGKLTRSKSVAISATAEQDRSYQ